MGNEHASIDNDNAGIKNLENENLWVHNVNAIIDHTEHDNAEEPNAQEPYMSANYNWHKRSRTPKWIIEIDEMIITNLEGKKLEITIRLWVSRLYKMFFGNKIVV